MTEHRACSFYIYILVSSFGSACIRKKSSNSPAMRNGLGATNCRATIYHIPIMILRSYNSISAINSVIAIQSARLLITTTVNGEIMKPIILFFILAIFSGSAAAVIISVFSDSKTAEWTQVADDVVRTEGVDAGRGVKIFVNKESIEKNGDRTTMWSLFNYESPMPVGSEKHFSTVSLDEHDCQNKEYRTLTFHWFSRHKAAGDPIYSETRDGNMQPIISGSVVERVWEIACGTG